MAAEGLAGDEERAQQRCDLSSTLAIMGRTWLDTSAMMPGDRIDSLPATRRVEALYEARREMRARGVEPLMSDDSELEADEGETEDEREARRERRGPRFPERVEKTWMARLGLDKAKEAWGDLARTDESSSDSSDDDWPLAAFSTVIERGATATASATRPSSHATPTTATPTNVRMAFRVDSTTQEVVPCSPAAFEVVGTSGTTPQQPGGVGPLTSTPTDQGDGRPVFATPPASDPNQAVYVLGIGRQLQFDNP